MTPGDRTVYVVIRASYAALDTLDSFPELMKEVVHQAREGIDEGERYVPEAAFSDHAEALREASWRERAAREFLNPFCIDAHDLDSLSSLSVAQLRAAMLARGVKPPAPVSRSHEDVTNLLRWWDAESANWTAALRAELWELFDKVKLYDVQEVPFE